MNRIQKYLIEALIGAFFILFACWAIGYFGNGLFGTKFDLASCWAGVSALGAGGVLAAIKYCADSWPNSDKGKMPYEGVDKQ
ncbi:MAG: hypothetical protein P4N41_18195 [Negativicutes bacterium]|nr:hypothetical protein [Negativicutes bacterium]